MKEEQRQKQGNRDRQRDAHTDREREGGQGTRNQRQTHAETNWQRDGILTRSVKDKVELFHVVHFVISKAQKGLQDGLSNNIDPGPPFPLNNCIYLLQTYK